MARFIQFIKDFSQVERRSQRRAQSFFYGKENRDFHQSLDAVRARLVHSQGSGF